MATSADPYADDVDRGVVDTLLRIASIDALRQHIPVSIWLWSNNQTFLLPAWLGWYMRRQEVVRQVRALGDIEILKSYFLLVWLDWRHLYDSALTEMCTSIREDFSGTGMGHHRGDLIERLDHTLGQLDRGPEYLKMRLKKHRPDLRLADTEIAKGQYRELKRVLLEVDREAMQTPTRTPSRFVILFDLFTSMDIYSGSRSTFMCSLPLPSP